MYEYVTEIILFAFKISNVNTGQLLEYFMLFTLCIFPQLKLPLDGTPMPKHVGV
jgi:hypothetical protein